MAVLQTKWCTEQDPTEIHASKQEYFETAKAKAKEKKATSVIVEDTIKC